MGELNNPTENVEDNIEVYPPAVIQVSDSSDDDDDDEEYDQYTTAGYALLPSEPDRDEHNTLTDQTKHSNTNRSEHICAVTGWLQ